MAGNKALPGMETSKIPAVTGAARRYIECARDANDSKNKADDAHAALTAAIVKHVDGKYPKSYRIDGVLFTVDEVHKLKRKTVEEASADKGESGEGKESDD